MLAAAVSPQARLRQQFDATFEAAGEASSWLRSIATDLVLANQLVFALEVCLEELFTNVVRHGGPGRSAAGVAPLSVAVEIEAGFETIDLVIEDNGRSFDVSQAPGQPVQKRLDEIMPGSLGMQLIRSFSTDLVYEALPFGNRVIVKFLRQPRSETTA